MAPLGLAQQAPRGFDRLFSAAQAERGAQIFAAQCATCHTPPQAAELMVKNGGGMTLVDYHARLSRLMPPQSVIQPTPQGYLDAIAFLARTAGTDMGANEAKVTDAGWRTASVPKAIASSKTATTAASLPWTAWRGDNSGAAYSPADQINASNVGKLQVAWRWTSANFGPSPEVRNITTPLMINGKLYATAGQTRSVISIDATTGETLWVWRPNETPERFENAPRKGAGRGVAYWSDGKAKRIFTVTPGFHLAALDAATGRPVTGFGTNGVIDLMKGMRNLPKEGLADVGSQSPPLVIGDVVVVGPAHLISFRPRAINVKGDVRGFDARTGRLLWTFRTIPQKGDPGYDTWAAGAAERTGNGGVWAPMSADPKTGAIFLPVESGTSDLYGGERKGQNLYTTSLVSLDAKTGKLRWAQQLVHHDIWDWDVPAIPILADIPVDSGVRRAVLQITKQAFVYAYDRDTGEPIWPIVERPVPKSDVPGEETWPTQPMPSLPAPFDRQGVTVNDLIDFTPALRAAAIEALKPYRFGAFMAPPSLSNAADGTRGTLRLPSPLGGANWEGGAYDPETGMLYVGSMSQLGWHQVTPAPAGNAVAYDGGFNTRLSLNGLPMLKPPYGRITAIDMKTGRHAWMIANADTPKAVTEHPDLKGLKLERTGIASRAGLLVTKTLLFAGEGEAGSPVLRAHDKATGKILAEIALPGAQTGLPMTYVWGGKQYVMMSVSNAGWPAEIVALALPD